MEKKLPVEGSVSAVADATISHASSPAPSMSTYAEFWRARQASAQRLNQRLAQQAQSDARQIADMLRTSYKVTRVVLFGSLVNGQFHARSDIDLAVEGLAPGDFFQALAQASKLSDFPIDLKPFEELVPHFAARVLATGEVI